MNKFFMLFVLSCCSVTTVNGQEKDSEVTTFYIVRHADRDGKKDALTKAGSDRSEKLKRIMANLNLDSVYSTDYVRTKETVGPTAKLLGLKLNLYGRTSPEWFEAIKKSNRGKVVLMAGHSNTVVPIVNGLGAKLDYRIEENEFDNIFVVQVKKEVATVVQLKYGR